jgi:hypothetical protein
MMRTDKHRVSAIEPADYDHLFSYSMPGTWPDMGYNHALLMATRTGRTAHEVVLQFDFGTGLVRDTKAIPVEPYDGPGQRAEFFMREDRGWTGQCDVCGAYHRHGDVWRHRETRECIVVGHICADKLMGYAPDRGSWAIYQKQAAKMRKARRTRIGRFTELVRWAREHRNLLPALKLDHRITRDIRQRLINFPDRGLSEKQEALVLKLVEDSKRDPEKHVPVPVDGERVAVRGTVVSVKERHGFNGLEFKMTVKVPTPDGTWLCWGTVPSVLLDDEKALRGSEVEFTAKVVRGDRDEHFGFFKRPTKARRVE